jgi:hypothetical protein
MSNPYVLFAISEENPTIMRFLNYWRHGKIDFETMLLESAKALETECNNLVDRNNLRSYILSTKKVSAPYPVLEFSVIPCLTQITNPLSRQTSLISAIAEIDTYYKYLEKLVIWKIGA